MSSSRSGQSSLQRGRACSNCRRRKIKCDGRRPVCTQCERSARPGDECEYAETGRSRTQQLEDTIGRLEARIRELEEPDDEQAVRLHNPYHAQGSSSSLPTLVVEDGQSPSSNPASPSTGTPLMRTPSNISPSPDHTLEEPVPPVIQVLLQNFLPHATEFGFFLNPTRFLESALRLLPLGNPTRPLPALLSVIYLWGVHLDGSQASLEPLYLNRALQHSSGALNTIMLPTTDHPRKVIHAVQAAVLLTTYFFKTGRVLEGKIHLGAAVSLVSGYRLYQLQPPAVGNDLFGVQSRLPVLPQPAVDGIEEGERINAFWTVYALCNCWSVAMGENGTTGFDSSVIDVPWPLDVEQYQQNFLPPTMPSVPTVENFLSQASTANDLSMTSLYVIASILLERASTLSAQLRNSSTFNPTDAAKFTALDSVLTSFQSILPPLSHIQPHALRSALLIHTLVHVAVIQLGVDPGRTVTAAESVFALLTSCPGGVVNPVMGGLWVRAGMVLVREVKWRRGSGRLRETLEGGLQAMAAIVQGSKGGVQLLSYQLSKLQAEYSGTS